MAEWEHKERFWFEYDKFADYKLGNIKYNVGSLENSNDTINALMQTFSLSKMHAKRVAHNSLTREAYEFEDWLNYQCEHGWEVFKISRDFNGGNGTWCIFRKKTE